MDGDTACAEGAISADCKFFAGYPITPATEIAERIARRFPTVGGIFVQMEDEIASMAAIIGASWGGARAMTATSGPGFSLMMENYGLAIMTETPCVIVNVMRAGPSTGLPTMVAQGDVMQTRWGSHGHYEVIAYAPSSPQEMFDFTVKAFNTAEKFRMPVVVLGDEIVGHMTEKVVIPPKKEIEIYYRRKPHVPAEYYKPYKPKRDLVPPMTDAGEKYHLHITGLTHDEYGYPVMTAEAQEKLVRRLVHKVKNNLNEIIDVRGVYLENAEIVVVAYGSPARTALRAIKNARKNEIKVGLLKLNTVWPFPEELIKNLAKDVRTFIVPEINYGQISLEIERCAHGNADVILLPKAGGALHKPHYILRVIKEVANGKKFN